MMNDLSEKLADLLDRICGGRLPDNRVDATALAGLLAFSLAPATARLRVLYCSPKKEESTKLIAEHGVPIRKIEWMVDFSVVDEESTTRRISLIACESPEMHPNHGCGYSFDFDDKNLKYHKDDYVWDFCKLLHFKAPHLSFYRPA